MITLALLLATDHPAPPPPPPAPPPPIVRVPAPSPPPLDPILRRQGYSEEAIALFGTDVGGFAARLREAHEAIAWVEQEIRDAMDAPEPDLAILAGLMRRRDQLVHRETEIRTEQALALAAALPLADRKLFLKHANWARTPRLRPRGPIAPRYTPPPPPSPPPPPQD